MPLIHAPRQHINFIPCSLLKSSVQVEAGMVESVRECTRQGVAAYPGRPRAQWVLEWPGQVVLVTTAIFWTSEVAKVCAGCCMVMQL
jgi:hypothetical protein